jgi:hypothetical protein
MKSELTGSYGDTSLKFSFVQLFPSFCQNHAEKLANFGFSFINFAGSFKNFIKKKDSPLEGSSEIERKKALKKLDSEIQKIEKKEKKPEKVAIKKEVNKDLENLIKKQIDDLQGDSKTPSTNSTAKKRRNQEDLEEMSISIEDSELTSLKS